MALLDPGFAASAEAQALRAAVMTEHGGAGVLDAPTASARLPVHSFNVALLGAAGVGKSALAQRLAGVQRGQHDVETPGLEVRRVIWPVKMGTGRQLALVIFNLWDAGARARSRLRYIASELVHSADAALGVFSMTNKASMAVADELLSPLPAACFRARVATCWDLHASWQVTRDEYLLLSQQHGGFIFPVSNLAPPLDPSAPVPSDLAPLLDALAETLLEARQQGQSQPQQPQEQNQQHQQQQQT